MAKRPYGVYLFDKGDCPENLLIVSHSVAIRCFLARWFYWTVDYFDSRPALPNCHVALMERGNDGAFALTVPFGETRCF